MKTNESTITQPKAKFLKSLSIVTESNLIEPHTQEKGKNKVEFYKATTW
jgi:HJR/Mrr/RecB family endonuclease